MTKSIFASKTVSTVRTDNVKRLLSLDILRGFDLFLLVFLQPVLVSIGSKLDSRWVDVVMYQLDHEVWDGFRFWDIVMPLFLFMTGASMPFSFSKYLKKGDRRPIYMKIVRRFFMLFLFGMIVQGNILALDPQHIYIYTNTLQAIAFGYLIASFFLLQYSVKTQIFATLALMAIYSLLMALFGDYSAEGNFANKIDSLLLGRFRGDPSYTWVLSSLNFGATVMFGTFAGRIMKNAGADKSVALRKMLLIGTLLVLAGLLFGFFEPIVKRLWSSSMTLYSGGICFLLMALFYFWIDCKGRIVGLMWLKIYGMNSITAYVLGEVVDFRSIAHSLTFGLERYMGEFYGCWLTFANFLILFFLLRFMYRHNIFLKV